MPRRTTDRRLDVLPRAPHFVTPRGYRVPVALRWHLLVEHAQRHGITLIDLQRALGMPKGATLPERRRRMRLVTVDELRQLEEWVEAEITGSRTRNRSRHPLAESRMTATGEPDAAA